MKSEKKEFVILSDTISMEDMKKIETTDNIISDTKTEDKNTLDKAAVGNEGMSASESQGEIQAEKTVVNATETKAKEEKSNKKNKKNKKKEKKERLESLKAIKAINSDAKGKAVASSSKEAKHIETEKEKYEVQELLDAEMNATMADIQQFMKSASKENLDNKSETESDKENKIVENVVALSVSATDNQTDNKAESKKKNKKRSKLKKKQDSKQNNSDHTGNELETTPVVEQTRTTDMQISEGENQSKDKDGVESEKVLTEQASVTEKLSEEKNIDNNQTEPQGVILSKTENDSDDLAERNISAEGEKFKNIKGFLINKKFLIASLAVIALLIGYCAVAYNYRETFLMRTKINGISCAGMTAQEAENALREKVEDYELNISFRDGANEVIKGESINYKYISDGSVQKLMDKQIPLLWLFNLIIPAQYQVAEGIEFDRGLLAEEYYALESTSAEKNIAPTNAHVTYEGDKFIVVPEDEGNEIDHHAFLLELNKIVESSGTEVSAADYDIYSKPTVYRDAKELEKECKQLNKLAVVSVTYTLANEEYVMDGNEVRNWLKVDDQGNYSITEEEMAQAIEDYVDRLADKVNTVGTERPFKSTKQGEVTVSGGTYGWKIDKKEEIAKLTEEIANRAIVTREPCYSSRELTNENNGFGDTYIEIDLTNQHLWYYIDGKLHLDSDLVSGTYTNKSRRTPGGVFLLTYKQKDRVLRGEQRPDGTYEYESPVSFWMPFNRGIGLHDASWRGSFGGTIYKYSGSHGCINLPYKKAKAIYEVIDKETPIICFY